MNCGKFVSTSLLVQCPCFQVPLSHLFRSLKNAGLWRNDPRLTGSMARMQHYMNEASEERGRTHGSGTTVDVLLDITAFTDCVRKNSVLIRRAFTGDLIIPEFSKFCSVINSIYATCRSNTSGKVASYIPQLARYSPDFWGVSLCTVDGQRHSIGDVEVSDIHFT
jgi:glutaminase